MSFAINRLSILPQATGWWSAPASDELKHLHQAGKLAMSLLCALSVVVLLLVRFATPGSSKATLMHSIVSVSALLAIVSVLGWNLAYEWPPVDASFWLVVTGAGLSLLTVLLSTTLLPKLHVAAR